MKRGFFGSLTFFTSLVLIAWFVFSFPGSEPVYSQDETFHSADYKPADWKISLTELLRTIQLYNSGAYHCDSDGEDGFAPGTGNQSCDPHDSDYNPQDWNIGLKELLRLTQFYNASGYHADAESEDGFAPGPAGKVISLNIRPEEASALPGHTQQFTAEITYENGVTEDVTVQAEWSSSDTAVAGVGNQTADKGLALSEAPGAAVISAEYKGISASANFMVEAAEGIVYDGTETTFDLKRGGTDQFLLPVEIGNQTLNLLVDTGSNALLVFDDRIARTNTAVRKKSEQTLTVTDTKVSKSYSSTSRSGLLATAPVRIGAYFAPEMRIMLIQTPDSQNDPSLTAKGADGIIGLRRTEGLAQNLDSVLLDVPLGTLRPAVSTFELDLPPSGNASLSFGHKPVLDLAEPQYVFRAKTFSVKDPANPVSASYSDLQVPFRAKSSFGAADTGDLDILLDTGAVSKLVLDTEVAKSLGYDPGSGTWAIPEDEEIELNLTGPGETITLYPKFRVSEISVAPYSTMGVEFEAVLGISRWQEYVVGFDFVDYQDGGPDGTISLLRRLDRKDALRDRSTALSPAFVPLEGLNSFGDERFPSSDESGNTIVFQSDRPDGKGGWDIYVWQKDTGILNLRNLNSTADDSYPRISADGRYIVFHSDRKGGEGQYDVYLYDLTQKDFVSLPGLNTASLERNPCISGDGRYIAFRSERSGGQGGSDIYLYDRDTKQYVTLPGLNTSGEESLPALNEDGSLLSFTGRRAESLNGGPDVYLYDVKNGDMISLSQGISGVNTEYREQFSAISPKGVFLAFQTDRTNPDMGQYDRDIALIHKASMNAVIMRGLNSDADDAAPSFSADGNFMLFHSRRPGGQGGSDIYMYRMSGVQETPIPAGSETGDIALTKTAEGLFTVPAVSGSTKLNLLVETGLSALVLFEDKISSGVVIPTGGDMSLKLPGGGVLNGKAATADIAVGNVKSSGMRIVLANSKDYAALTGLSLSGADGVFGMYRKRSEGDVTGTADIPLAVLQPEVSMAEFNFDPAGVPGMSIGSMPIIAGLPSNLLFNTHVQGRITDPENALGTAFTDLEVTVTPVAVNGEDYRVGGKHVFLLSSTLKNRIILDTAVAAKLGDLSRWQDIYLFVMGSESMLRAAKCPSVQAEIKDLSGADYDGIIGIDFWQNFVLGFDTVGFAGGGPSGVVSFLKRSEIGDAASGSSVTSENRHFVSLPGLNSAADDSFGDISDDGNTIVFESNREGTADIYIWRSGQGLLNLAGLNSSSAADTNPRISADGNRIVFASDRSGSSDVYLYDIAAKSFIDLPGLNTEYQERLPDISAYGTVLAFRLAGSPENIGGKVGDIRFYSVSAKEMLPTPSGWLNTEGDEVSPSLNRDGTMTAFAGTDRPDAKGGYDVYLWKNADGGLAELGSRLNTASSEGAPSLSADGGFMALVSDRNAPDLGHRGRDIFLFETASQEFLFLPGLNSEFEEGAPAVSENAKYILFHSKRPGGEGGYDIYLYQRDTEDTTPYTASESYTEDGTVSADGAPVANAKVRGVDANGKTVATVTTDDSGRFSLTVSKGTALPVTYKTNAQGAEIVTDEVGDDTYVPDFQAGNLKFTQVWVEDKAQTGLPSSLKFDIEAEVPKYNVSVRVYLKAGNPSEIGFDGGSNFTPDYVLTGLIIDRLGQRGPDAGTAISQEKDVVTKVTCRPGTNNLKAHVEHSFVVPSEIPDGIYTAVFSINVFDYSPEDDAIQGEETSDLSDNYMVASAATIIGNPDKPNLRILSAKLLSSSFELPGSRPDKNSVPEFSELNLNMEVESMAQDTTLPVDVIFELEVDGQKYPMSFFGVSDQGNPFKSEKQTYPVTCRPEDREGYPEGDRCASLFRQEQTGKTYHLFINDAAYDVLSTKTADTSCTLVITMDPLDTVEEYSDNKVDNVMRMPVMFLRQTENRQIRGGPYAKELFNCSKEESYGNEKFGAGYKFGPKMTYNENTFNGVTYPYAANFDGSNGLWVNVFKQKITILDVGASFDFNGDNIIESWFDYGVTVLGVKVYGKTYAVPESYRNENEITLWDTKNSDGNEKYSKSAEVSVTVELTVYGIPVAFGTAGAVGEVGIRGKVKYLKTNRLMLEAGPYASLHGFLEAGALSSKFGYGLGIDLLIMEVYLKLTPSIQILPSFPVAIARFEAPIVLSTLDGEVYFFIRAFVVKVKIPIIEWKGLSYEFHFFPPLSYALGAAEQYKTFYYNNPSLSGQAAQSWEGLIYHNWGSAGPSGVNSDNFSARWTGYYRFPGWEEYIWGDEGTRFASRYTFYMVGDDRMTVWIDNNDNDKFEDDEKIFNGDSGDKSVEKTIKYGIHKVQVDYVEGTGNATAKFYWLKQNQFGAWYFNNKDLSGDPVYFNTTENIDFDWKTQSPKKEFVNADGFSVKWEGDFDFPANSDYLFSATADDGIRIYADNTLIVDGWKDQPATTYTGTVSLTKGSHRIRVEYYDNTGDASVKVWWAPKNTFVGIYYNNTSFSGTPALKRDDIALFDSPGAYWNKFLNGNWGENSPGAGVNKDDFSVRWEGAFSFDAGDYDFLTIRDDGMKVWVDGDLIFSHWEGGSAEAHLVKKTLTAGYHKIRIEFVEYGGRAVALLKWGLHKNNQLTVRYWGNIGGTDTKKDRDIRKETADGYISYNWRGGSPYTLWGDDFSGNNFKVTWEGDVDFEGAPYIFTAKADDKLTLWVDGAMIICADQVNATYRETLAMNQGSHHIKAEYVEDEGDASVSLKWEKISPDTFYYECFKNTDFKDGDGYKDWGSSSIGKDWGNGSGPCGNSDNFSIRWNGVFEFAEGKYIFRTNADDKIKVWVDGEKIIDGRTGSFDGIKSIDKAGYHSVRVEFVEYGGLSKIFVDWRR